MKQLLLFFFLFSATFVNAQDKKGQSKTQIVEAACGQCQFKIKGHGDAHADDGFCAAIRKAEVAGEIVDNRFKAIFFKLLPKKSKSK